MLFRSIDKLEQEVATLRQTNLGYQQSIEQLMSILQPPKTKPVRKKTSSKIAESPKPPPAQRAKSADTKILAAINIIMLWNSQNTQKFAISQTLLLKATSCNMPAIKRVTTEYAQMIDRHHAEYNIQPRNQSKKVDMILDFMWQH